MRVMYIIGQLGRGGAEQQLYYILKYTNAESIVVVLEKNPSDAFWAKPMRSLGCRIIELERIGSLSVRRLLTLIRVIKQIRPDIVVIFGDGITGLYGRLGTCFFPNTQVIVCERSNPANHPQWLGILKAYFLNWRVNQLITNSFAAADYLRDRAPFLRNRIKTIVNGIEFDSYSVRNLSLDSAQYENRSEVVVGTVASLRFAKSPETFVAVAAEVLKRNRNIRFVYIGKGVLLEKMKDCSVALGIEDRITWMGQCDNVPDILPDLDIFLLTSRYEGLPNVIMEAMAAGLPCVTTNAGDAGRLVLDGVTGFVVPVGNEKLLVERVNQLIEDRPLRVEMGKRARERIKSYDVRLMAQSYMDLYSTVLGRDKPNHL